MADLESKVRGMLLAEAKRHRHTWMVAGRPNTRQIASELGLGQATVYRILHGRSDKPRTKRKQDTRQVALSPEVTDRLMTYFRFSSLSELIEVIENTPSAPPVQKVSRKKRK